MAIVAVLNLASTFDMVINILYVALGLGLVIFFHELGHFAVAKWCNVYVERFSIGFGPIIWSWKRGETEYALSAVPFGGYVKMLGQDDMDPSQLSSEEIAEDPRSYSSKPVWQRMAIISAGVIMNVATAVLFFAVAFGVGIQTSPSVLGSVHPGLPAWEAGLESGDRITRINDREATAFADIMRGVALSTSAVSMEGVHRDGTPFQATLHPDKSGTRRVIGVEPTSSLQLIIPEDDQFTPTFPGMSAAEADPPFQPGDTIRRIDGEPLEEFWRLQDLLARRRAEPLDFQVQREGASADELVTIRVSPNHFRTLGLWMDIGQITNVVQGSPADLNDLRPGDKIASVNNMDVGTDINPLRLPDYFADQHGELVTIVVKRPREEAEPEEVTIRLTPLDKPGWVERPTGKNAPLSVPAIGVAFNVTRTVLKVEEGAPADGKIQALERIKKVELVLPEGAQPDGQPKRKFVIDFDEKSSSDKGSNWAYAFWMMQSFPTREVHLTVSNNGTPRTVELMPVADLTGDWYLPSRGIRPYPLVVDHQADNLAEAMQLGVMHTRNSIVDIYLTLRSLVGGLLSVKELHGPLGIATVAYKIARQGLPELLLFLGFLSVNLAVLNFLPIPILDGGHMVFLCWEAITRRKPSERVLVAATYLGAAFVLGLMVLVLYLDIFVHGLGG